MTGGATLRWSDPALPRPPRDPALRAQTWELPDAYDMAGLFRWPRYSPPGVRRVQSGSDVTDAWYLDGFCSVPGWMVLQVVAAPTALLWWKGRRRIPRGHCWKCGYDLTGNVSGRCPERGEAVPRERAADDAADSRT
jgi:hypothetical protein